MMRPPARSTRRGARREVQGLSREVDAEVPPPTAWAWQLVHGTLGHAAEASSDALAEVHRRPLPFPYGANSIRGGPTSVGP